MLTAVILNLNGAKICACLFQKRIEHASTSVLRSKIQLLTNRIYLY